ncbi:LysR family transcriptional regulator [Leifsonia poae]|uniref:LysR family transcriptional regulator n=1 Tax=Leifsonia poae TaxID=110933 RepID=UPI001CBDB1D8|nr:LysR family transcriptional regulator [Leifsonia poae]
MRIDEIAYFRELAADGQITHTAEALDISPAMLSKSLGRLEAEVGVQLFDRHKNRLELNGFGEILLAHVVRALTELDTAQARIDALRDPTAGVVSIAYVSSFGSWLIPRIVSDYRQIFPQIRFAFDGGTADAVLDALRSGSVDLAFLSPEPHERDIDWRPLTSERLALGVPAEHPLAGRAQLTALEVEDETFVAMTRDSGLRQIADAYFSTRGVVPRVVMEVTELATLRGLVRAGVGVALLPDSAGGEGMALVPLKDEPVRTIGLATNRARSQSAAAAQFARFVQEEWS